MSQALSEQLKQTAMKNIKAYSSPNPWDIEAILAVRAKGFTHDLHPKESLDPNYRGNIDENMLRYFVSFFKPVIESQRFDVQWMTVDPESRTVVASLLSTVDLAAVGDEPAEPDYKTEYIWYTRMDESGEKIVDMQEFIDVQRMSNYVGAKAHKYAELQGGQHGDK